jgi:hypothetical protein
VRRSCGLFLLGDLFGDVADLSHGSDLGSGPVGAFFGSLGAFVGVEVVAAEPAGFEAAFVVADGAVGDVGCAGADVLFAFCEFAGGSVSGGLEAPSMSWSVAT